MSHLLGGILPALVTPLHPDETLNSGALEKLLERVRNVGAYLNSELKAIAAKSKLAGEVRGVGMMQALELTIPARPLVERAMAAGVLLNSTQDTVLRFLPPYILEEKHVDKGMRVLRKLLREMAKN